ncbi:hypothetical protein CO715_25245 [Escherichia coli M12]|nr:hypothetical protein CO715_25245 [Escherichia coli M12]
MTERRLPRIISSDLSHLMTLVMSMSVIGISADYTLYYLTERMVHGNDGILEASMVSMINMSMLTAIFHLFQ